MKPRTRHIVLSAGIFAFLSILSACGNGSTKERSGSPAPGGTSGGPGPVDNPQGNTPSNVKLDSPQDLAKKTEVKGYHTLVRDGDIGYSGYCVASSKKPETLDADIRQLEIKEGPCPTTLKINSKNSPMVYACAPSTSTSGAKEQVFLYETMNTDLGFQKITEIEFDVVGVFCANGISKS